MSSKSKAVLMLIVWIFGIFGSLGLQVSGAAPGVLTIGNSIVELMVNKEDGRFSIKTVEGSQSKQGDEDAALLFEKTVPETTFTSFRIDGKDYIYGNAYNGLSMDGGFVEAPTAEGMTNTSTWKIGDISVTQKLELTDNLQSSDVGNVKISYSITNTGTKSSMIGTRVLLDMMLGDNDGCKVSLDGKSDIMYETETAGEDIPVYWQCADDASDPKVVAYGFVKGWGNTEPDKLTIAHWNALSATKWDYEVNPKRVISSALNDFESADSAVALYWEPEALEPGNTIKVETYYGLGNINKTSDGSTFNLNIAAPSKLSIEGEKYKDNPFDIIMEIDNSIDASVDLAGITAELVLPDGLELVDAEEGSRYFYRVPAKDKQSASWKVRASDTQKLKILQYMIRLTSMGKEIKNEKKFIIIPGFDKSEFDIGYTDIVPNNIYYNDDDNAIQLIGYGFDKLRDQSSYDLVLTNTSYNNVHYPAKADISIVSDSQMRIKLPKGLTTGTYKVSINHKNDILDYTLTQTVNVTAEERYKSRNYGILLIKEETIGSKTVNTAKLVGNESEISSTDRSAAVLIIRGRIKSTAVDRFDVYGDTIAINNDVYYKGYGDKVLSVYKEGDSFIIKGNGELYMTTALMGKSMDITLKKGHFYIDSASALIKDEEGYINDLSIIYVEFLPILVDEIKLQKNGEVKIDGALKLDNKYFNFLTGDVGKSFIESDMKDIRLTNKNIDIDAEFTIPFPHWKIGGFESQYRHLKSQPDYKNTRITFFINTIKGAYGFKSKAQNLKLRLRNINAKMAFDKELYPDYFEFENQYGNIPEPIGSTGLAYESIGGGIYGLRSMYEDLKYGNLPTGSSIKVTADIVDLPTYYARIKGYTMIGIRDIEGVLNNGGIDLRGDGYIYFLDVGDIEGHFDFSGGYIAADINVLDVLIMEAFFSISENEIKGSVKAEVRVPGSIPFIGGEKISGFKAGLSTREIEGSISFCGVGVDIAYEWGDGSVDFDVDYNPFSMGRKGIYAIDTKDEKGRPVRVTYGANIQKLRDVNYYYEVCYAGGMGKTLALGASEYKYDAIVDESVENVLIQMKYNYAEVPHIEVKRPDGSNYNLVDQATGAENANYRHQIIPSELSASGMEEKLIFVTIPAPELGKWTISSDKEVILTLFDAKSPAAIETLSAKQEDGKIKTTWSVNETVGSTISLYLVREDGISESAVLAKELDAALGAYEIAIPAGVTTGDYKVYAEAKRNGTGFNDMYSSSFEISDAEAPGIPAGFKVTTAGNGMLEAEWEAAAGANEYRIFAVDAEGNLDKTVEAMISTDGDKTEAVFGGISKNAEGKEHGWLTGRTYRFALYAVNREGEPGSEEDHISRPAYSGEVYLPVPEPPAFEAVFASESGTINAAKDENNNDIRYTNAVEISCSYSSDTAVKAVFYKNGEKLGETQEKSYDLQIEMDSGSSIIEIEAIGEKGDKAVKAYEFYYDDKAPDLMVQSPGNDTNVWKGTVTVSGKTTAGSRLYVNGTQLAVSEDGSFNAEYALSDEAKETVTIASVDLAGNRTEYYTEVLNSAVSNVVKVEVSPSISHMRAGESIQFRLYGVTEDDKRVLLEQDKTSWQLYDTETVAALTPEGLLRANKPGEIIVNGKYSVSAETAYEDAITLGLLPAAAVQENNDGDDEDEEDEEERTDIQQNIVPVNNGVQAPGLLKRFMDFKANEEVTIPGLMTIKFSGKELLPGGFIEVHEIKDTTNYIQQDGEKDFVSNILDIRVPEGYKFNSPVGLTIYFDKTKVKDIRHIAMYVYDEKTGTWEIVGGTVDERNASITASCPHFSKYAVMEDSRLVIMEDMNGHWARNEVYRLVSRGIINGVKGYDGRYRYEPERTVSRAEFAKMLALSAGFRENNTNEDLSYLKDFGDIKPWALPYLEYCSGKGWIKGKSIGKELYMKPADTITRAEAAAMVSRAVGFAAAEGVIKSNLSDKNKIPAWASGYIDKMIEKKLMLGYSDDTFRPDKVLTRAEAAKIFDTYVSQKDNGL